MIQHTQGIVIKSTKYSETSIVANIFTKDFGMQGFLVQGVYRKKSIFKPSYFQHLNRLNMVVYFKSNRQLQKIKELQISPIFQTIPFQIEKTSMAMFIAEVLNKTILEEESNEELFQFLTRSIQFLDEWEGRLANFPLIFLVQLSKYLGFFPHNNFSNLNTYFNLQEGYFQSFAPEVSVAIQPNESYYFSQILDQNQEGLENLKIPSSIRQSLLEKLMDYFRLHLDNFSRIRSSGVLREVLKD